MSRWLVFSLMGMMGMLSGCADSLARQMVAPPNGGLSADRLKVRPLETNELRISVGPPEAVLSAWVMEPVGKVRGTILGLHGFLDSHSQLTAPAKALVEGGYRVVLLDLRGHGASTGDYISYGVQDAHDLVTVVDVLQKKNLCGATVGVLGASYGATTAIHFAAIDPRVKAVVAIAPFTSLREEAPYFGRHILPIPGLFYSEADFVSIVDTMGQIAGFDPDQCDSVRAIQKSQAKILLFHGEADMITPVNSSIQLAAAAPDRTELVLFPMAGHLDLCFDLLGRLRVSEKAWFDRHLALMP